MSKSFREIHITGEGFRTLAVYRLFFAAALRDVRKRIAEYDAEVRDWYAENPGYQFPQCIHGSSLVTDYDNICGWCEDSSTPVELAIVEARSNFLRFLSIWEWINARPAGVNLAPEVHRDIMEQALALFPKA